MPLFLVSGAVLIYQIVIGGIIVICGALGSRKAVAIAAILAAIWTLTHVIMPPLMCVQFVTITVATALALVLASVRAKKPGPPDGM